MKGELHKELRAALDEMPRLFLEELIRQKLVDAGVVPTKELVRTITDAAISGDDFEWENEDGDTDVDITFTDDDLNSF